MKSDLYNMLFPISLSVAYEIAAIFFLTVGLRGILTKRPFLILQKWLSSIMFVICAPTAVLCSLVQFPGGSNLMSWLSPLVFGSILLMICYQMKGYMAYAVTDASFRKALIEALQKLLQKLHQLPYEESLSLIRLCMSHLLELAYKYRFRGGWERVKSKSNSLKLTYKCPFRGGWVQRAHRSVLRKIVNEMNEHFRMSSVPTNMITCVFLLIIPTGGFMVMFAIGNLFSRYWTPGALD